MKRHAYLIMANENFGQLKLLLSLLDDERNDIYLHIDKKAKMVPTQEITESVKRSCLYMVEPMEVYWGEDSQIFCELRLLRVATENGAYAYYHLLSGKDLPIKSQDYIHSFFEQHDGREFVRFGNHPLNNYAFRYKYFWGILKHLRFCPIKIRKMVLLMGAILQRCAFIDRTKKISENAVLFAKGTNWFSITDELARYTISKSEWIRNVFENTYCCDEVFLQTLIVNSHFRERLYHAEFDSSCYANMRLIDWRRGSPYVFREQDLEEIRQSDLLFARKFDEKVDGKIIWKICSEVL